MSEQKSSHTIVGTTSDNNLERIREILFGQQMADLRGRLDRIEKRFDEDLQQIRRDTARQLEIIGNQLREEMDRIADRLNDKKRAREEVADLFADISILLKEKLDTLD
ncbi:MAG: hypothetical protein GY807_08725 [Gammaproteobacteria bacterium]|nr:hypothetical protein [Gammaproteobacteria bacterium]